MADEWTLSHHLLRRRARKAADKANRSQDTRMPQAGHAVVEKALRGPWRWRVVWKKP